MANTRLEALKSMVALNPADSFSRYGLAMEYRNSAMRRPPWASSAP